MLIFAYITLFNILCTSTDGRSQEDKRSLKNKGVDNNKPTPYHKEKEIKTLWRNQLKQSELLQLPLLCRYALTLQELHKQKRKQSQRQLQKRLKLSPIIIYHLISAYLLMMYAVGTMTSTTIFVLNSET